MRFLVFVVERESSGIARLLGSFFHEPLGIPSAGSVSFVRWKTGVGIPSALAIDKVESILGDVAEAIDEPDRGSVFRARAKNRRCVREEDIGQDLEALLRFLRIRKD